MKKNGDKKIAVLIPCYNEEKTIAKVVKDYKKVLPNADIYVYDNNSTDKTDEKARKAGAIVEWLTLVTIGFSDSVSHITHRRASSARRCGLSSMIVTHILNNRVKLSGDIRACLYRIGCKHNLCVFFEGIDVTLIPLATSKYAVGMSCKHWTIVASKLLLAIDGLTGIDVLKKFTIRNVLKHSFKGRLSLVKRCGPVNV